MTEPHPIPVVDAAACVEVGIDVVVVVDVVGIDVVDVVDVVGIDVVDVVIAAGEVVLRFHLVSWNFLRVELLVVLRKE